MRIKHWQGYGSVEATKIKKVVKTEENPYSLEYGIKKMLLIVKVSGNHEWGLENNDTYDVYNWLVKRFAKEVKDYTNIIKMEIDSNYDFEKSCSICTYYITCTVD